jgi:thymidylate synthase
MLSIHGIRKLFVNSLYNQRFIKDKTGVKVIETCESFDADENAIFGAPNDSYIMRELAWYSSMSRNVHDIPGKVPDIWLKVSSKDGMINSNYGWCVFSAENGSQFKNVLRELKENPESRRAIMIYTRPSMWKDYNEDGMSDFMCTNSVQYMIRDGVLNAHVNMRSNDAIFGYRNDWAWQKYVLTLLAYSLEVPIGKIYWNAASLHVYERHFWMVDAWGKGLGNSVSKAEYLDHYPESQYATDKIKYATDRI